MKDKNKNKKTIEATRATRLQEEMMSEKNELAGIGNNRLYRCGLKLRLAQAVIISNIQKPKSHR